MATSATSEKRPKRRLAHLGRAWRLWQSRSLVESLEDVLRLSWLVRRKPLESFLLLEAALEEGILLGSDGSLVSLIRVEGARSMMGPEELALFVELAARRLNNNFLRPGHALHIAFERAPDLAEDLVERSAQRQHDAAGRLGLALDDLFAERRGRLAPLIAEETLILACWSRPALLSPSQAKRDRERQRGYLENWIPRPGAAQCPFKSFEGLFARHAAFLDNVSQLLGEAGLVSEPLDSNAALCELRRLVNGHDTTASAWRPVTCVNDAPARDSHPPEIGTFPPPLAPQLLIRTPLCSPVALRMGDRLYGALDMQLGPRQVRAFSELMDRMAAAGLPFRFSMLIEGGGLTGPSALTARIASSFLAFSSDDSRLCRDAMNGLHEMHADAQAVVRLRIGFLTWVGAGEGEDALARRVSRMQQIVEGWGEIVATPLIGDPLEAFVASLPGFACGATAEPALAPLTEALAFMPVSRPAPLARRSINHPFRSSDGKLLPYSFEEGEDYGFDIIYGLPGRGKSVLLNSLTLAFSLQSGQDRLPYCSVIDIGPSSAGVISLIREALPPERRHEAGYFQLQMDRDHAINPFDTQLGCRYPLAAERAFIVNLLSLLLTPAGAEGIPDGMRELIGPTIAEAYKIRSDKIAGSEPQAYTPGRDPEVDGALKQAGCRLPRQPLWWDVVDALFDAGQTQAASRAQRYAVPVMTDLLAAVRQPEVQGLIGEARHGQGGESVTAAFIRIVNAASASWPVLFNPTAFEIGDLRLAAIDLRDVAPQGSAEADRQTAVMYMLARQALTRHWWVAEEAVSSIPEKYRSWHRDRLRRIRETPKRLCFDEFHRTGGAPAVRAQVERDVRETRKLRVRMTLASQRLEDFGPSLVALANRYWLLGAGGKVQEAETLSRIFDLSKTLIDVLRFRLPGPGKDGAPALLIANNEQGRFEQLVVNTPGPVELWALTTSPRDVALRDRLYGQLTPRRARAVLARRFPEGTARDWIDNEVSRLEAAGIRAAATESEVLDQLAKRLAAEEQQATEAA